MSIKIVSENRKARFDFHILETFEAGMVLRGSEVKSLRGGHCQLKDSYVVFQGSEMFLQNAHIGPYAPSGSFSHDPERKRKLLMHRNQIDRLAGMVQEKGLTLVPLKVYFLKGRAKVEVAVAKGKKRFDKRESIKERESQREMSRVKR